MHHVHDACAPRVRRICTMLPHAHSAWASMGQFGVGLRSVWGRFGVSLVCGPFEVCLGLVWGQLVSVWGKFGCDSVWGRLGLSSDQSGVN